MAKPFDAATMRLLEAQPSSWLEYVELTGAPVELIEADLTTITTEADKVLRVRTPDPYLAHIEFQSTYEADMGERVLRYNVLLYYRHRLPVQSVVVLLRREADGPGMTGTAGYEAPVSDGSLVFRYHVVRAWEKPVQEVLAGGLATLPLAPLADVSLDALPSVIRRMEERIDSDAPPGEAGLLWTATYLLMGLTYDSEVVRELLKGVRGMKESATYQALLEEGGENEARKLVLRLGEKRFGTPDARMRMAIESVASLDQLERLAERILEVESWNELLAAPSDT